MDTPNLKMYAPNAPAATIVSRSIRGGRAVQRGREDATPDPGSGLWVVAGGGALRAVGGDRHRLPVAGVAGEVWCWVPVIGSQMRAMPSQPLVASQVPPGHAFYFGTELSQR